MAMIISYLLGKALPLILKVIVGPLTYLIGRALLNAWRTVDELNPGAKRVVIFVLALFISAILQATGQQLPGECTGLAAGEVGEACVSVLTSTGFLSATLTAAIGAGMAFLIHAAKKSGSKA
jgi:hypothetical protein